MREYNPGDLVKIGNTVCKIIRREGCGYRISNNDMCYCRWVGEDLIEPYKEDGVQNPEEVINAKVLLELNACEDGFKWFVDFYGKSDVGLKELDFNLKALEKTSYRQWLHEKFPQLKKKERTFKVGDKFVLRDTKSVYILSRWQGLRQVTLFREDGTDFMDTHLVSVNNTNHITEDELNNIHKNFFVYFDPI